MNIVHEEKLSRQHAKEVQEILYAADGEFVPALSAREGTTQTNLQEQAALASEPVEYFEKMCQQAFVLATIEHRVVGFLSYIPKHALTVCGADIACSYVSTIVVAPEYRGRHLTEAMYEKLFSCTEDAYVATRTWSENHGHIHILDKLNFYLAETIKDDRGAGIDTVYYVREIA
ncbi:MAG: GNAT family N-acetyltransferase [Lachnospiraceae bacterium]|nr:GNAT family N-acetyltransferase [Lachnospiraceae bacterium]